MSIIDIIIVIIYLIGLFLIGLYARTRINTVDDYLVAGNRFATFSLVGTTMASLIGAGMLMGIIGNVYTYGSGIIWNYIGFAFGFVVFAAVYVTRLRSANKRTMAEIIAGRFGRLPRFFVAIFAALYAFALLANCVTGMARLLTYIFGSSLNITAATVIAVFIGVVLTAMGGLYSVVWTDTIQFVIMIVVILIAGPVIAVMKAGGLDAINTALSSVGGTLTNPVQNVPVSYMVMAFVTVALSVPGDPTVPQRALAGKDTKTVKKSFYISALMALLFGVALTLIGGGIMTVMPDIAETYGTTEAAFPVFIIEYFPPVLAGIAISALMAVVISTITSMLLVGTTHLVYDAGQALFPNIKDEVFMKAIPIATVVVGVVITFVALQIDSMASMLYFAFSLCGAAFVVPMLFVLFWKKTSKWGVTLGVVSGAVCVLVMSFLGISGPGGDPVYLGLILSTACCVFGSLLLPGGAVEDAAEDQACEQAKE